MADNKNNNPLFAIFDALFCNKEYINNITYESAKQNIFMILRRLAIAYPLQANAFNDKRVNPLDVVKYWSDFLYCGKKPAWTYVKGVKASEEDKKKGTVSNADIKKYKSYYNINDKDFEACMRFYPDETIKDIEDLMKFFKQIKSNSDE